MKQQMIFFAAMMGFTYAVFSPPEMNSVSNSSRSYEISGNRRARLDNARSEAMVLDRDGRGQFHLSADVDGQPVEFLVDTGADIVALTVEEAERLGLEVDPESFAPVGQTASGVGNGQVVSLDRLEVAGSEFRDVDAVVMEGLSTNLLGQSILRQLGGVTLEGDQMVIHR
jgi:aspartyl protease family protein